MKVTIGKPIGNVKIYIVDRYLNLMPIGITGELCVAGDSVGAGYLNRPELTAEKFIDNPFGTGELYKTGDLAYWREDGNIVFVGRNDSQVKIRGLRIELGEIENAIAAVDGVDQAAVVVRKNNEGRQLICAFYTGVAMESGKLRSLSGNNLPKYMLPHIITHLDELPLTPSGKISRKALPEVDLYSAESATEYVASTTENERVLVSALEAVLIKERISVNDNFFDIGGDSLKAIELITQLEELGYSTDISSVFASETIRDLAAMINAVDATLPFDAQLSADTPASPAQMRVYMAQNMAPGSTLYNVPYAFTASTDIDIARLQKAVDLLIERNPILKSRFENRNGIITQVVDENAGCIVEKLLSDDISLFIRPFYLTKAPLMRVGVYDRTVIIDIHHIVTDGGSMPILLKELNELYMGRVITAPIVDYRLFAMQPADYSSDENYWLSVFNDDLPELTINTDFKRGSSQSFNGDVVYNAIDGGLWNRIKHKCTMLGITPFAYFMAGFNILLSKFSGCEDIVVGMPVSGRSGKFVKSIGMFVNTVAMRNRPDGNKTVKEFLLEVKDNSLHSIEHQKYPFSELVKKLGQNRSDRNPIFDVMFAYQGEETTRVLFGDLPAELLPIPVTTSKYDFTFNVMPRSRDVVIMAEYCTDLYSEQTITRFILGYIQLLEQMLDDSVKLKVLSPILPEELQLLLYGFNDNTIDFSTDKCIHQLFEEQTELIPDSPAVVAYDKTLSYRELNEEANCIAHYLIKRGIGKGDIVAVILPRNSHLIPALFGVLKTGASFMPIDPSYPENRKQFLLNESAAGFVIDDTNIQEICAVDNHCDPRLPVDPDDLFCALHTSGSTGRPKLTALTHKNLLNFLYACNEFWDEVDTVICVTIVTFDIFMQDTLLSLALGKKVVLASEEQIYNQSDFEAMFEPEENVMFFSTPTKLTAYIKGSETASFLQKIKTLIVGGEVFTDELYDLLQEKINMGNVRNGYGPAETTIGASYTGEVPPPPPKKTTA